MKKFYPIGTVVTLIDGKKPLMIYGRLQLKSDSGIMFDYVACLYPEGNINDDYNVFFNHENIEKVLYMGYQTEEDDEYQVSLYEALENQSKEEQPKRKKRKWF